MVDYPLILRRLLQDHRSYTQILAELGGSRRMIANAARVIRDTGITADDLDSLTPQWYETNFPDGRRNVSTGYAQPNLDDIINKLKSAAKGKGHATLQSCWSQYCSSTADENLQKYSYSQFCRIVNQFVDDRDLSGYIEHTPGFAMQVDWAGDKIPIYDAATGTVGLKASVFVASMPYSGVIYAQACSNQREAQWLECHVNALNYFGHIPPTIVPDNDVVAVYRPTKGSSKRAIVKRYQQLARHYEVSITPTRCASPKDKPTVERTVQMLYTMVYAYIEDQRFYTLDDLNAEIQQRVDIANKQTLRPDGKTRWQTFQDEEVPYMKPLPGVSFSDVTYREYKVGRNWHIHVDYRYYSMPMSMIGQIVTVKLSNNDLKVYDPEGQLICIHQRSWGPRGSFHDLPEHMVFPKEVPQQALTRTTLMNWAHRFGPATCTIIAQILDTSVPPCSAWAMTRAHKILLVLGKRHNGKTLEPACQKLKEISQAAPTYRAIEQLQRDIHRQAQLKASPTTIQSPQSGCSTSPGATLDPGTVTRSLVRPASHYQTNSEGEH